MGQAIVCGRLQSRIYLGIHWSFDKTAGIEQGRQVAAYVFENALR